MKPIYWVLIGLVLLTIVFLIINSNRNKNLANINNTMQPVGSSNQALTPGGTSQVSQIISSLFPFFKSALNTSNSGPKRRDEDTSGALPGGGR